MKKLLALVVLALFSAVMASAAESPMYVKTVSVAKVTSHEKGYRVVYFTSHGDAKTVYIPLDWFYQTSQFKTAEGFTRAEIARGYGAEYPYLQIFWKEGKFHHLRLCVVDNYTDPSWGSIPGGENWDSRFDPAKDIEFQF